MIKYEKLIQVLDSWVDNADMKITFEKYETINEHYLHHWVTQQLVAGEPQNLFSYEEISKMQLHLEWPSWKNCKDNKSGEKKKEERIMYAKEGDDGRMAYTGFDSRSIKGTNGWTDLAIGPYSGSGPEVLVEFKWNNQYEEWAFDFFKLFDFRLSPKKRVFFGVRSTKSNGNQGRDRLDEVLEEVKKMVSKRLKKKKPLELLFYDVWVGGQGEKVVRVAKGKSNDLDRFVFKTK